jgi:hypothetical protein
MEWNLATTPTAARISFGAAVDAATAAACWRVDLVDRRAIRRLDLEGRHAKEAIFLHTAEFLSTRCDSSFLVAAALATAKAAAEWTVYGDHLGLSVCFLLGRSKWLVLLYFVIVARYSTVVPGSLEYCSTNRINSHFCVANLETWCIACPLHGFNVP